MNQNVLRVYGCGGAGLNIARQIGANTQTDDSLAVVKVALIDTSASNAGKSIPDNFFLITDHGEGSGKIRRDNHAIITDNLPPCLAEHPPGDFNVVIFSAGGGSGSVIGPLLVRSLISDGHPTIALVVGSADSSIAATNTLNTLKSLSSISNGLQTPLVFNYQHNSRTTKRSEVDTIFKGYIEALSALVSGENDEMDTRDLANWIFYDRPTDVPPQLSLIELYENGDDLIERSQPIAIASLLTDKDQPIPETTAEYVCHGYRSEFFGDYEEMHFSISVDSVQQLIALRQEDVDRFTAATKSRASTHRSIVSEKDNVGSDDLVL